MLLYWIWLTTRKGLSGRAVQRALAYFASPEEAYRAPEAEYRMAGLGAQEALALADKSLDEPRRILDRCAERDIRVLTEQDAAYSARLRNIADAPAVLYYTGVLPALDDEPLVAVVGSRKSSPYGLTCAKRLGYQIAACGGVVVSGLAAGGDAMAMTGAVSAGRPVVGVLGCGVDVVYPKGNRHLYEDIRRRGCLISEYPPETPPYPQHFPARNRIISGLSLGVVVVEAPAKSGALITAQLALEQGRDVFAVPGNIGLWCCEGSNRLLKEGAALAENGWDVMQEYERLFPGRIQKTELGRTMTAAPGELRAHLRPEEAASDGNAENLRAVDKKAVDIPETRDYIDVQAILEAQSEDERQILLALRERPRHVDELVAACGWGAGRVLSALTLLEIKNYVKRLPGNRYELAKTP